MLACAEQSTWLQIGFIPGCGNCRKSFRFHVLVRRCSVYLWGTHTSIPMSRVSKKQTAVAHGARIRHPHSNCEKDRKHVQRCSVWSGGSVCVPLSCRGRVCSFFVLLNMFLLSPFLLMLSLLLLRCQVFPSVLCVFFIFQYFFFCLFFFEEIVSPLLSVLFFFVFSLFLFSIVFSVLFRLSFFTFFSLNFCFL